MLLQLNVMLTTPVFNLLPFVAEVSDGLFRMLADGQPAVRDVTETLLGQFLQGIRNNPESLNPVAPPYVVEFRVS